jgi:hypothetical protein
MPARSKQRKRWKRSPRPLATRFPANVFERYSPRFTGGCSFFGKLDKVATSPHLLGALISSYNIRWYKELDFEYAHIRIPLRRLRHSIRENRAFQSCEDRLPQLRERAEVAAAFRLSRAGKKRLGGGVRKRRQHAFGIMLRDGRLWLQLASRPRQTPWSRTRKLANGFGSR